MTCLSCVDDCALPCDMPLFNVCDANPISLHQLNIISIIYYLYTKLSYDLYIYSDFV